jgi:hypothetical protein
MNRAIVTAYDVSRISGYIACTPDMLDEDMALEALVDLLEFREHAPGGA